MFTAQRLFGRGADPEALLGHTAFLERTRAEQERGAQATARSALAAYLVARLVDRWSSLQSGSLDHDGFRWQLESTRRYVADVPGDQPEAAHLAGIVESVAAEYPRGLTELRMSLTAYSYFLEHEGRLEEALDILALMAGSYAQGIPAEEFTRLALFVGRLNRLLARWDDANRAYAAAEAAAQSQAPAELAAETVLRSRLGRASVLRGQGDLGGAREVVEEVIAEAMGPDLRDVQAGAYADLGAIFNRQGLKLEAVEALYESFVRTDDPFKRMRILGDLGIGLAEVGAVEPARMALQMVVDSQTGYLVRLNARLELMDLDSAAGNRIAFERARQEAQEQISAMPPSMAVDFRYKVGIGLLRFGQMSRGRAVWSEALALAEQHELNHWFTKLNAALADLDDTRQRWSPTARPTLRSDDEPRVGRLAQGLREYAQALAG